MSKQECPPHSLALYKNRPALVKKPSERPEIELENGKTVKVRPKDIVLLHPGPLQDLTALKPQAGEVEAAWELLLGETTTLEELAELTYNAYTPATAWAAWQLVEDGLYYQGTPEAIVARPPEEVTQILMTRETKAAEAKAWAEFMALVQTGKLEPDDVSDEQKQYIIEVERLALGLKNRSRLLRELKQPETDQAAHTLLLDLGYWDQTFNPHPQRSGVTMTPPQISLPDLPEEDRLDLTHLPAFAIDDIDSSDPDDALSLEGERLWVHVADAAALITPNSPTDLEAQTRGANLYLPETIIPMLPPEATPLLGLGLSEISPALSFGLDINGEGEITKVEIKPSWVRVQRLTYEVVDAQYLDQEPFGQLYHLAQTYEAHRQANGAIDINLPEIKVRVKDGQVSLTPIQPLKSRVLVREAMLMAGEAIARFAQTHDIPIPYTTQAPPEPTKMLDGLAGQMALLRSMKPRQQKSVPGPHAGLGLDLYAPVTSPLRRYLDLVLHQQLRAYHQGELLLDEAAVLERVGAAEAVSGSIRSAERRSNRHWTLVYLQQNPDWQGEGIIVDRRGPQSIILIPRTRP